METTPTITADVESSIFITLRIPPGTWIRGTWSIVSVRFEIYRQGGEWFTHVSPAGFRAVRRPDNYRGHHHSPLGVWSRKPVFPGFSPRVEMIPQDVLDALRVAYEAHGVSPSSLPPMDAVTGKGPVR